MLQNRVDPSGNIISISARGAWMGNRGQLHNEHQQILRPFKLKAWLICMLNYKDRHRKVMSPNRYTELFFLDEATAFAAGHRPCFECRRKDYDRFKAYWVTGNRKHGFNLNSSINNIDKVLHRERIGSKGEKITYKEKFKYLPEGTFIQIGDKPYLLAKGKLHPWTAFGYETAIPLPETETVTVLTPKSTVNAFTAGYKPQMAIN
ncbi:MAG: hypothetical protein ACTHNW_19710 [Mucilaginibacter sp.]